MECVVYWVTHTELYQVYGQGWRTYWGFGLFTVNAEEEWKVREEGGR